MSQCFPSRIGGIESLMHNLSVALSEYKKTIVLADKYDFIKDSDFDLKLKGIVEIKRVGGIKFLRRRKKISILKSILKSQKVECVIGDSWKSFELAIDYLNLFNVPTICLAHGNELVKKNNNQFKRLKNTLNKVSSVVCNSNFTKNLIKKLEIKKPIIRTIYPGVEDSSLIPEKIIPSVIGDPILLTLSRLEKRKGHKFVIEMIPKLKEKFPKILYVIAGSGKELINLKNIVRYLKLYNHVIFVGDVNSKEKKFLLNKASLMVMPTIDDISNRSIEGFGISYIEAALQKLPSIASNVGGSAEAVLHNKTGIILEDIDSLYEKIELVLTNDPLLSNLGKAAYERASKEFKWPIIVKIYLKLIEELNKK